MVKEKEWKSSLASCGRGIPYRPAEKWSLHLVNRNVCLIQFKEEKHPRRFRTLQSSYVQRWGGACGRIDIDRPVHQCSSNQPSHPCPTRPAFPRVYPLSSLYQDNEVACRRFSAETISKWQLQSRTGRGKSLPLLRIEAKWSGRPSSQICRLTHRVACVPSPVGSRFFKLAMKLKNTLFCDCPGKAALISLQRKAPTTPTHFLNRQLILQYSNGSF